MKRPELGKEGDPLQDSGVFRESALQPLKSFFVLAKRDIDGRDGGSRHVSRLAFEHELIENLSGLVWLSHEDISNGKTCARQMPDALCLGIKLDRLGEVSVLSISSRQIRIQIEIVRIQLECSLTFGNRIVDPIVRQIGGSRHVTSNGRNRIQSLSF